LIEYELVSMFHVKLLTWYLFVDYCGFCSVAVFCYIVGFCDANMQ